jgi:GNAT superfamily N-acetyltransferase
MKDITDGIGFVMEDIDGVTAATAAISFKPESTYQNIFEGQWNSDAPYAVIHRFSVARDRKRSGVAGDFLKNAEQFCSDQGVAYIRIDTHAGNIPMRKFLEKQGFKYCGVIYLPEGRSGDRRRLAFDKLL